MSPEVCGSVILDAIPSEADIPYDYSDEGSEMALQTAEAPEIEAKIADAAVAIEALAQQIFGPAAYIRRSVQENRETGEDQVVLEVHYCFPNPESDFDQLAALHKTFMHAVVRSTGPGTLSHFVLKPVPSDAD